MKLLIRWVITAVALFVAQRLVPGIEVVAGPLKDWQALAAMAAVLGLVNALIRPFLSLITCPIQLATLGLFTLVLNAIMLWLSSRLSIALFEVGLSFDRQLTVLWGSIVVSLVSLVLSAVLVDAKKR
jgi:putative membrane protein